jgi:urease accessory protein
VYTTVILTHEQRERGRLKLVGENGEEIRVFLDRGKPLLVGEYLRSECGKTIQIVGAVEDIAHASCEDWTTFAKACYHLGNRHTKVEVGERWLRIKPDHVLEEMLHLLGLVVTHEQGIFNPESGAYSHGHHHH